MSCFLLFRRHKPQTADSDFPHASGGGSVSNRAGNSNLGKRIDIEEDPILPEKKRARRRLVGAITITLAAIIVLPMIFDSEPQTVSQDILIDIPSRDKPSQIVAKDTPKRKTEDKTIVNATENVANVKQSVSEQKNEKLSSVEISKDKSTSEKTNAQTDTKKDIKPVVKDDAKGADTTKVKQETKKTTDKKIADPIGQLIAKQSEKRQDVKKEKETTEKFVIQVAAVSTSSKAKELQNKLKNAGLNSYAQKVTLKEGGERIRIRIGPLSGKKEVNNTCAKLSQLKLPCTLVN